MRSLGVLTAAVLGLVFLALATSAAPTVEYTTRDSQRATTAFRTNLTGADSTSITAPLSGVTPRLTRGNQTIGVSVRFSGATSDTVVVRVISWASTDGTTFTFLSRSDTVTVTASSDTDTNSDNVGPTVLFDSGGVAYYSVRVAAPSAGNVDLHTWSY